MVAPSVQAPVFVGSLAPVVLSWVSPVLSAFSHPATSVVALPGCAHASQRITNHHPKYLCDDPFQGNTFGKKNIRKMALTEFSF